MTALVRAPDEVSLDPEPGPLWNGPSRPLTNGAIGISKGTTLGLVISVPKPLDPDLIDPGRAVCPTPSTVGAIPFLFQHVREAPSDALGRRVPLGPDP